MAIALDISVAPGFQNGVSSKSWSHTCTGSNLILFVFVECAQGDDVTGATYNSVAMTQIAKVQVPTDAFLYLFYLIGPATGANNVVVSASTTVQLDGISASYTGVNQSGQPDANTTNTNASYSGGTNYTTTLTTIADNCWTVMGSKFNTGQASTAGANATKRQDDTPTSFAFFDSSGVIHPAGSVGMTITNGGSGAVGSIMASFKPVGATTVIPRGTLLGVG